jgi:phosphatidate cytidylyltransferase
VTVRILLGICLILLVVGTYVLERWLLVTAAAPTAVRMLPSTLFLALLAAGGAVETSRLLRSAGLATCPGWAALGAALHLLALPPWPGTSSLHLPELILVVFVLGPAAAAVVRDRQDVVLGQVVSTALALLYIPFLLGWLIRIRLLADGEAALGLYLILAVVLATKSSDIFAYLGGMLLGRHKAIPRLSPGKTWEGYAGGLLGCALASFLLFRVIPGEDSPVPSWLTLAVLVGVMAVLGPLGDLMESVLKRAAGVKDSGALLPEFGGVLDVVDSLAVVAPAAYLVLALAGT